MNGDLERTLRKPYDLRSFAEKRVVDICFYMQRGDRDGAGREVLKMYRKSVPEEDMREFLELFPLLRAEFPELVG